METYTTNGDKENEIVKFNNPPSPKTTTPIAIEINDSSTKKRPKSRNQNLNKT